MNLDGVIQWVHQNPHWGGVVAMLISGAESVAIIGTIVPGSVMMTAIGTLIGMGVLPLWSTIIWAIAGAVLGDGLSYFLGFKLKDRIRRMWPFSRFPKILDTGEGYFKKHGGKSVFFGRFVGPVRAIVPMIAGMIGLKPIKFIIANICSAIIWAPAYMVPGYLIGTASLQLPPNVAIHLILSLLLTFVAVIFITWLLRLLFLRVSNRFHTTLDRVWLHFKNHRAEHFLTVWFKSSNDRHVHGQLGSAFAIFTFGILFIFLLVCVITHSVFPNINQHIYYFFRGLRLYGIDQFFVGVTFLGQAGVLIPTMLVLSIVLIMAKQRRAGIYCFSLMVCTSVVAYAIKHFVHSPRPGGIILTPSTYSFPSGHVTLSVAFYSFVVMLLLSSVRSLANRKTLMYTYTVLIILIALSRLYLGAHWLTDVLAAICLGAVSFFICKVLYYRHKTPIIKTQLVLFTVLISLAIFWSIYFYKHFTEQSYDYQRTWPIIHLQQKAWWQNDGESSILVRHNRFGYPDETLNVQWAASMKSIENSLNAKDWQPIQKFYWKDFLHPTKLAKRISIVPVIPKLFRNTSPQRIFIKRLPDKNVLVLRLWNTHIRLLPRDNPLWVGLLSYQQVYINQKLLPLPKTDPLKQFTPFLKQKWKMVQPARLSSEKKYHLQNKNVLLIE